MFTVGEMVVYPSHGVAQVSEIRTEIIGGTEQLCYILEVQSAGPKPVIKLPVDKAESNGVRRTIDKEHIPMVIEVLRRRQGKATSETWIRKFREYQAKMATGDIIDTAEVLKELSFVRKRKGLSISERRLFDQARDLVIKELAIVQKTDEKQVEQTLDKIVNTNSGDDPTP